MSAFELSKIEISRKITFKARSYNKRLGGGLSFTYNEIFFEPMTLDNE